VYVLIPTKVISCQQRKEKADIPSILRQQGVPSCSPQTLIPG
jgi:hypothetical protein